MADRYWVGDTDSDWNDADNWASSSGGAGGSGVPASSDDVIFDDQYTTQNCTCDVAIDVASLDVQSTYDGILDFADSAYAHSIGGTATFDGSGTIDCGNAVITISGNFSTLNFTGSWIRATSEIVLDTNSTFYGNGLHHLHKLTIDADVELHSTTNVQQRAYSTFLINTGNTFTANKQFSTINGGAQIYGTLAGASVIFLQYVTTIGATAVISASDIRLTSPTWNITSGATFNLTTVLVNYGGTFGISAGSMTFNGDWTFNNLSGDRSIIFQDNVIFTGNVIINPAAAGEFTVANSTNDIDLSFRGDLTVSETVGTVTWVKGTGTITLDGTGAQAIDFNGETVEDIQISNTGGTVTFGADATVDSLIQDANTDVAGAVTITVTGDFVINGTSGNECTWNGPDLDIGGTAVAHYTTATDSDASAGTEVDATDNCTDGTGNTDWNFAAAGTTGLEIQANQAAGKVADDDNFGYWNTSPSSADQEVYGTIATKPATDEYVEFLARFDFSTGNGYGLRVTALAATDKIEIMEYSSWTPTQLGTDINQEITNGDAVGFGLAGTVLQAYYKPSAGSWALLDDPETDSTYTDSDYIGLNIYGTTARLDDFGGGPHAITLSVNDSVLSLKSDNLDLTQAHTLSANDSVLALKSDNLDLTQAHTLSANDSVLALKSDNLDLTQAHTLSANDSVLALKSDNLDLTQANTLSANDSILALKSDNLDLTQANTLSANDSILVLKSDNVTLSESILLSVDNSALNLKSSNIDLFQTNTLFIDNSIFDIKSNIITLSQSVLLSVDNSIFNLKSNEIITSSATFVTANNSIFNIKSDNLDLIESNILSIDNSIFNLKSNQTSLTQANILSVNNSILSIKSDHVAISQATFISTDNCVFDIKSENLDLIQSNTISINDSILSLKSSQIDLTYKAFLVTNSSIVTTVSENITLGITLSINDCILILKSEQLTLPQANALPVNDSILSIKSASINLIQANTLSVNNSILLTKSESLNLIQANVLITDNCILPIKSSQISLPAIKFSLNVNDSILSTKSEQLPVFYQKHVLTANQSKFEFKSNNLNLIQANILTIDNTILSLSSEEVKLIEGFAVTLENSKFEIKSENLDLVQANRLHPDDSTLILKSSNIDLIQANILAINNCVLSIISEQSGIWLADLGNIKSYTASNANTFFQSTPDETFYHLAATTATSLTANT